jgi:hypothetical protein
MPKLTNCRVSRLAHELLIEQAKREKITYARAASEAICAAWRVAKSEDLPARERKAQQALRLTEEARLKLEELARFWGTSYSETVLLALHIANLPSQGDSKDSGITD